MKLNTQNIMEQTKLSVLIPARNEEKNIKKCLDSIYYSGYPNLEVIVLDDNSTDSTFSILSNYKKIEKNLNILKGKPLQKGWLGKNWACHQLAEFCTSEIMLFIDADVVLQSKALNNAVEIFRNYKTDLLSVFPTQKMNSAGERLLVPLMDWVLYTFLPLKKVYTSNNKSFSAANGQFLMMNKESYNKFGGHEKIKNKVVEDVEFVRGFKGMNLKTVTLAGNNLIFCRMYEGFSEALNGFSKNFYPGFNLNALAFIIILFLVFTCFFAPLVFVFLDSKFVLVVMILLLQRVTTSSIANQNVIINLILFFPHMIMFLFAGIKSVFDNKNKKVIWKERKIA